MVICKNLIFFQEFLFSLCLGVRYGSFISSPFFCHVPMLLFLSHGLVKFTF